VPSKAECIVIMFFPLCMITLNRIIFITVNKIELVTLDIRCGQK
jgi:hypothetical protein